AALLDLRRADDGGPIDLARGLVAKGAGEMRGGGRGAGDQQDAARVLVEAVDQAWALVAVEAQSVEELVDMAGGVGADLRGEARRLVDDDRPVVAIDHAVAQGGLIAGTRL